MYETERAAGYEVLRRRVVFLRELLVSPFLRRVLFVVAAAIRSATLFDRPRAVSLRLMCSYWRLRFALFTPRGGIGTPPRKSYLLTSSSAKSGPRGRSVVTLSRREGSALRGRPAVRRGLRTRAGHR
jgi:hypothetical protein